MTRLVPSAFYQSILFYPKNRANERKKRSR